VLRQVEISLPFMYKPRNRRAKTSDFRTMSGRAGFFSEKGWPENCLIENHAFKGFFRINSVSY